MGSSLVQELLVFGGPTITTIKSAKSIPSLILVLKMILSDSLLVIIQLMKLGPSLVRGLINLLNLNIKLARLYW